MYLRKSNERGLAQHGWLHSQHTFSFADYHDPSHMGFGPLRVINEDRIQGGSGFGTHGHRDMEILTYVVQGALRHQDSLGNTAVLKPGEVQRMSAGTGVLHSEFNDLSSQETHFLQIWILPKKMGVEPSYAQESFELDYAKNQLVLVASEAGAKGSITLNQDVNMYVVKSAQAGSSEISVSAKRRLWFQLIRGGAKVDGVRLEQGDGLGLVASKNASLEWNSGTELLVFDLP